MKVFWWLTAMWFWLAFVQYSMPNANLADYCAYFCFIYLIVYSSFVLWEKIKNFRVENFTHWNF